MVGHGHKDYRIIIDGIVTRLADERLYQWQTDYQDGRTILTGSRIDSAALYGLLAALRDNGLVPLSIRQVKTRQVREEEE